MTKTEKARARLLRLKKSYEDALKNQAPAAKQLELLIELAEARSELEALVLRSTV